jgi:hypothetical protein
MVLRMWRAMGSLASRPEYQRSSSSLFHLRPWLEAQTRRKARCSMANCSQALIEALIGTAGAGDLGAIPDQHARLTVEGGVQSDTVQASGRPHLRCAIAGASLTPCIIDSYNT